MADIFTSANDEELIKTILRYGLQSPKTPKNRILWIALAKSLQIPTAPDNRLDMLDGDRAGEYAMEQVTGEGLADDSLGPRDYTDALRAMLSTYHEEDMFTDEKRFRTLLQRHIRRGLREISLSWNPKHDFFAFLYQDLFSGLSDSEATISISKALKQALDKIGVRADIRDELKGPRIKRILIYLPDVNYLDRLQRGTEKIALSLGLQKQGILLQPTNEPKIIGVDIPMPRESWKIIHGSEIRQWATNIPNDNQSLPVWPGVDVLGKPFYFDLNKSPHLLVAGTTGSGKSVCLHALIISLLYQNSRDSLVLAMIDPKQVEFAPYEELSNLFSGKIAYDEKQALVLIENLVLEMEKRTRELKQAGVSSLDEGLKNGKIKLPRIVVFVEELADLIMRSGNIEEGVVRLAQKARSTGIHLVLATQRPDAETFNGLLRANAPARIALSVQKSTESKIILDVTGAEKLMGSGDMLVIPFPGIPPIRLHGVLVNRDDIGTAIRSFEKGQ